MALRAECLVVVVPASWETADDGFLVVGVDGSEVANLATRFASEEPRCGTRR